jgi:DNA-binding beta-propeller fold protein YncE
MTLQYGFASGRVFCLQVVFRKTGINSLWFACLATLAIVSWAGAPLAAQTAHFGFAQSTISSNLQGPQGIAIGADGTIYVADTYNNRVVKEVPSGNGFTR